MQNWKKLLKAHKDFSDCKNSEIHLIIALNHVFHLLALVKQAAESAAAAGQGGHQAAGQQAGQVDVVHHQDPRKGVGGGGEPAESQLAVPDLGHHLAEQAGRGGAGAVGKREE